MAVDQLDTLLGATRAELAAALEGGLPVDPAKLRDTEYYGVSLGLGAAVEALTWKTFKKVFRWDAGHRTLRGWNVAVEQDGPYGAYTDKTGRGGRQTYGHYVVRPASGYLIPGALNTGLVLDYGPMAGSLAPMRPVRDVVVAMDADAELLLGWLYLDLGAVRVPSPSYFTLRRGAPLTYDVSPPRRAWAG